MKQINENAIELTGKACEQGTEEWLRFRKSHISATDLAPIVGISPWASALSLYKDKTSDEIVKKSSPYIEWGSRLESAIIDKVVEELGMKNVERGKVYVDGWKMASLDGEGFLNGEHVGIEAKTASDRRKWIGDNGEELVPAYYVAQATWQMIVCGFRKVVFTVLIDGHDWLYRIVEFNSSLASELEQAAEWFFFKHLECAIPVSIEEKEYCFGEHVDVLKADIKMMVERCKDKSAAELPKDLVDEYKARKLMAEEMNVKLEESKLKLLGAIGEHECGTIDGKKVVTLCNGRYGKYFKFN